MTNREKYKQAFSVLHASGGEDWDALAGKRKPKGKTAARLVLLAAVSLEVARVYGSRLPELRSKSQALDAQIQQTEKQNDVLRSDLDHEGDPDFIQGLARDDLGLASDGERIFYDVNN